ncbi:hypothetical protein SprV_0100450400 [Sparganum proliferum]
MVSFDVTSLFTSIPQDLTIETIELLLQSKYDETENRLGRAQVLQLLKFCLRTYFTFDGTIYEQVKGTPMGSPISGFIAEAVLQRLESLVFQHHKPKFWARYVDDTFVVIDRNQLLTFKERLNAVFPDIQFTMEEEENNQLAFLDVLVCRKDCGGLKTKVFRKATNTMQVLNFNSNHPISHKRSCVRTLYRRVETHCSELEDKIAELQYLRQVFKANGYPRNFVNRCIRKRDERPNRTDTKVWRALPYVKNVSEAVGRLLASLGVGVAHRPEATIRRQLMKPKDPLPRQETSGVVYRIWCSCGQSNYVGETGRQLQTRMAEHAAAVRRNDASSQVAAHSTGSGHTFKFDEAEILARGDNRVSRELLESWFTGPQSINKCNDLPIQYSVLRLRLGGVIGHAGSAQVNTHPNTRVSASDGRAIITPASNARDEIAAINDANVGHHARATIPDEGGGGAHMIVDGVNISNPNNGSHCVAPNDCWEVVKPEKLLVAYGLLKGSTASFTVESANIPHRYPVGIQYKKAGTPDCVMKFDVVLFTGHLGTKPRTLEIKFGNGRVDRITITPSNKPEAIAPILTFIDFENSFKKY